MPDFEPNLSPDGYIRMTTEQLQMLTLQHGFTTIASEVREPDEEDASSQVIYGTSEWMSTNDLPKVSLSWDWKVSIDSRGEARFTVLGEPYSNVRIVDNLGQDESVQQGLRMLRQYVEGLAWQAATLKEVKQRL